MLSLDQGELFQPTMSAVSHALALALAISFSGTAAGLTTDFHRATNTALCLKPNPLALQGSRFICDRILLHLILNGKPIFEAEHHPRPATYPTFHLLS